MSRLWGGVTLADPWNEAEGVLYVANLLWDTNSLAWVKQTASSGVGSNVAIADGSDACQGSIADAAVVGDTAGTLSAKIRGLSKILNDVWNSTSHVLNVNTGGGAASAIIAGQKAVTSTASALPSNAGSEWTIRALSANSEPVYVGPSSVTVANGFELNPGQEKTFKVSNTNALYVISNNGGTVCYAGS